MHVKQMPFYEPFNFQLQMFTQHFNYICKCSLKQRQLAVAFLVIVWDTSTGILYFCETESGVNIYAAFVKHRESFDIRINLRWV